MLADRLKRLVSAGLLTRENAGPGRRAAYSLTEASIQLVPVFTQLGEPRYVRWVPVSELDDLHMHPSMRLRVAHGVEDRQTPYLG